MRRNEGLGGGVGAEGRRVCGRLGEEGLRCESSRNYLFNGTGLGFHVVF